MYVEAEVGKKVRGSWACCPVFPAYASWLVRIVAPCDNAPVFSAATMPTTYQSSVFAPRAAGLLVVAGHVGVELT